MIRNLKITDSGIRSELPKTGVSLTKGALNVFKVPGILILLPDLIVIKPKTFKDNINWRL